MRLLTCALLLAAVGCGSDVATTPTTNPKVAKLLWAAWNGLSESDQASNCSIHADDPARLIDLLKVGNPTLTEDEIAQFLTDACAEE